jgi:hypothetical protein
MSYTAWCFFRSIIPSNATPPIAGIDQGGASGTDVEGECVRIVRPRDEVGVNRGPRCGAIFANRADLVSPHEEVVAQQRERVGGAQTGDEVGVDRIDDL